MSPRSVTRFIGVDLGGGRGKTTVLAELRVAARSGAEVVRVAQRAPSGPWTDDTLAEALLELAADPAVAIAIDAPLTQTACARCVLPACPGMERCEVPAVVWLRTEGRALLAAGAQLVNAGTATALLARGATPPQTRLAPHAHRATDVHLAYARGLVPVTALGAPHGAIAARAHHLRKRLASGGVILHERLIEVSPPATIAALCGPRAARGYKRDADPWRTRAEILESLDDLAFAPSSRMAREEVLANDHGFDAVIAGYTAYRWARDHWDAPPTLADDGWIFAPR